MLCFHSTKPFNIRKDKSKENRRDKELGRSHWKQEATKKDNGIEPLHGDRSKIDTSDTQNRAPYCMVSDLYILACSNSFGSIDLGEAILESWYVHPLRKTRHQTFAAFGSGSYFFQIEI
jgi:hypothetical protein